MLRFLKLFLNIPRFYNLCHLKRRWYLYSQYYDNDLDLLDCCTAIYVTLKRKFLFYGKSWFLYTELIPMVIIIFIYLFIHACNEKVTDLYTFTHVNAFSECTIRFTLRSTFGTPEMYLKRRNISKCIYISIYKVKNISYQK